MATEEDGSGDAKTVDKIFKDVKFYVIGTVNDSVGFRFSVFLSFLFSYCEVY